MTQPVLAVGHGAAGLTLDPRDSTYRWMTAFGTQVREAGPQAVVVVSAHWEAGPVRVATSERPPTVHDHPVARVHDWAYPAAGEPRLAAEVLEVLTAAGTDAVGDPARGLDHGAWIPLSLMIPDGRVPVVGVSLSADGDVAAHLALGRALAPLRDAGVLILTSGGATHDQAGFRRGYFAGADPSAAPAASRGFDDWLGRVLARPSARRGRDLGGWRDRPDAATLHPTDEHLMPFVVAAGAAGDDRAERVFTGYQHGLSTAAHRFG